MSGRECECRGCDGCEKANGIKIGWRDRSPGVLGGPTLIVCTVCRRSPLREGLCGYCLDEQRRIDDHRDD